MEPEHGQHAGPSTQPCYIQAHSVAERTAHPAQSTSSDRGRGKLFTSEEHTHWRQTGGAEPSSSTVTSSSSGAFHRHGCWAGAHTRGQRMEGNTSSIPQPGGPEAGRI